VGRKSSDKSRLNGREREHEVENMEFYQTATSFERRGGKQSGGMLTRAPEAVGSAQPPTVLGDDGRCRPAAPGTAGTYGTAEMRGEITPEQERLMLEHLPTVRYLARRIHERLPQHVEIDDLVSAGVLGLIDAFRKFDPAKKVQFRSYAQFRIRGAILDSLRTLDWSPRELRRKGRAIEEAIRALTARLGRTPTEPEIASELGIELGEYQQLLGELKGLEIGTLHVERSEDSGDEELAYIPNKPEEDPLFVCLKSEMRARLAAAVDQLPERERLVMTLYYYEEMTMKEIGLTLGVVESRVSQIHASAVLHLRALLAAHEQVGRGRRPKAGRKIRTMPDNVR